jgi:hypothetical protein
VERSQHAVEEIKIAAFKSAEGEKLWRSLSRAIHKLGGHAKGYRIKTEAVLDAIRILPAAAARVGKLTLLIERTRIGQSATSTFELEWLPLCGWEHGRPL